MSGQIINTGWKSISFRRAALILAAITLLIGLAVANKFWFPYDDGITLVSSELILSGHIPYKDFALQYPPLPNYTIAALFSIFGVNHLIARLYIILLYMVICAITFYIAWQFSKGSKIAYVSWLTMAFALAPRLGANLSSSWSGMCYTFVSIFLFYMFASGKNRICIFLSGLAAGAALLSKQDMGVYVICAVFIATFYLLFDRPKARELLSYIAGVAVLPSILTLYLIKEGALKSFIDSMLVPATVLRHYTMRPMPIPCFDLTQIFYGSLRFISINQFYIPILTYAITIPLLMASVIRRCDSDEPRIDAAAMAFLVFGVALYYFVLFCPDDQHLIISTPPAIILFSYIYAKSRAIKNGIYRLPASIGVYILLFLLVLFSVKNADKFLKNCITKPLSNRIIKLQSQRGGIYIPKQEYYPVKDVLEYIGQNTAESDKILVWNRGSAAVSDGTDLLIYFFSGRLPPTRYFVVLPGYTNSDAAQEEIVSSLKKENVKLVVLLVNKDSGKFDEARRGLIDQYVDDNYSLTRIINYFYVYLKK